MFDSSNAATGVADHIPTQNGKCCAVQSKQRNSTPVNDSAKEFHYPPVSRLLWVSFVTSNTLHVARFCVG